MIIRSNENIHEEIVYKGEQFKLTRHTRVPDGFLQSNYELRKDKNSVKSADGEWWLLYRIPTETYIKWYRQYPELRQTGKVADDFLKKLMLLPENEIYRTYAGGI